jgi:hypothetical protein
MRFVLHWLVAGFDQFDRVVVVTALPLGIVLLCLLGQWVLGQALGQGRAWLPKSLLPAKLKAPAHASKVEDWQLTLFHAALFTSFLTLPAACSEIAKCFK